MGMIDRFIGIGPTVTAMGNAAGGMAEIFRENATRRMELDEEAYARAIGQLGLEFQHAPQTWFDGLVNGMNRLPRPGMTIGVLGLFGYAMVEPDGFALRMEGLNEVPEPLWWLLGAIVSFYFGAREAHYFRNRIVVERKGRQSRAVAVPTSDPAGDAALDAALQAAMSASAASQPADDTFADNAALRDWVAGGRQNT